MLLELCDLNGCLEVMCGRGLLRTIFLIVFTLMSFICKPGYLLYLLPWNCYVC